MTQMEIIEDIVNSVDENKIFNTLMCTNKMENRPLRFCSDKQLTF